MAVTRLEAVKALVEQSPGDSRIRFMLCMEYLGNKMFREAVGELNELIARDPAYVAAYFQGGRASEELGDEDGAREFYRRGMHAAKQAGDSHTLSELQAALDILG